MAHIRGYLLAIIGIISGARVGLDILKNRPKKPARPVAPPSRPQTAVAGAKRGAVALPWAGRGTSTPAPPQPADKKAPADDKPVSAPGAQAGHHDVREIHGAFGYVMELFKRFGADHCPAWAASLSFFSILSIAPVLLCALAVLSFFINPDEATAKIQQLLANVLPGGGRTAQTQAAQIISSLKVEEHLADLRNTGGVAGIIGLLSLFWSSTQIFLNAMTPMNAAFRTEETRGFVKLRLVAFGLLAVAGLLFLLSLVPAAGGQIINALHIPGLGKLPDPLPPILAFIAFLVGVAINAAMFTIIYRWLPSPSANIDWKEARFAGIIVAILWEAAKIGFAFYLRRFGEAGYNKVYGTLGGAIGLVFWIYYSSMILLLGAEIAKLYSDRKDAKTS